MTLSQIAVLTRQTITLSTIAIVLGIAAFVGYKIWYAYYLSTLPPVEEKPDIKFGQLPPPDFPLGSVSSSNFSYSIDTATGNLPKVGIDEGFEKIIKVYFIPQTFATLLAGEKSKELAEKFDIKSSPRVLSETEYIFEEDSKSLIVNLDSGNFIYENEATISGRDSLDDDNKLVSDFQQVLKKLGVFTNDLEKGRTKVLHQREGGTVFAQISLWPPSLDKKSIFTSEYDISNIFARVYQSATNLEDYLLLNYINFPIDSSTFATYPLKTAEAAFEDLKNGKGVVVIEPTKPQVSITSVYLGYFLPDKYTPYLQPIYVFEGPHFAAYISAINEEFQNLAK